MKKEILLVVLLLFSIVLLPAQLVEVTDNPEDLEIFGASPEDFPETTEEFGERSTEYLKQEWLGILEKTAIDETLNSLSPFFIFLVGLPFAWSWILFLAVIFWFSVVFVVYRILKALVYFFVPAKMYTHYDSVIKIGLFALSLIISTAIRIPRALAGYSHSKIIGIDSFWGQIIAMVILTILLLFIIAYSKLIERVSHGVKQKKELDYATKTAEAAKKKTAKKKAQNKGVSKDVSEAEAHAKGFLKGYKET